MYICIELTVRKWYTKKTIRINLTYHFHCLNRYNSTNDMHRTKCCSIKCISVCFHSFSLCFSLLFLISLVNLWLAFFVSFGKKNRRSKITILCVACNTWLVLLRGRNEKLWENNYYQKRSSICLDMYKESTIFWLLDVVFKWLCFMSNSL